MTKPKLLWVGDATVATGFAKVTHNVLDVLKEHWDVSVLGLNYLGDPYDYHYPIYPCRTPETGDAFGTQRFPNLVSEIQPDMVVIQNDPWNISAYIQSLMDFKNPPPVVASMPVDGKNFRGDGLEELSHAIFWTKFGEKEAQLGGYEGSSSVIPLGVDNIFYHRKNKQEARTTVGLPEEMNERFIVGNINRNQPRKRLDLTIKYFCEWIKDYGVADAYLSLHICPTGDMGYDVKQLMRYYGLVGRLILVIPSIGQGIPEEKLVDVYNTFDVQVTTTQGEGWGLTTMEGMACGVPQIIPEWSALGEWAKDGTYTVSCPDTIATPTFVNVIGGVPSQQEFSGALNQLYGDSSLRNYYINEGYCIVEQPQYRWKHVGEQYNEVLQIVLMDKEKVA